MERDKTIIRTSVVGIVANLLLVVAKAIIGLLAGAISIVTDAVNNLTDALSSIATIVGTKLVSKRPNKKHPYGYGRIEFVTSAIIAMLIVVAACLAMSESVSSLIERAAPTYTIYSFVVISLAVVVKVALGLFFRYKGKKADSGALRASGIDALLDSLLSLGTLVGAIVSYTTGVHLEGYIGLFIGLFMLKSAVDVFREAGSQIIGERADPRLVSAMTKDISSMAGVYGVYDLIINNYGVDRNIASVHIEVDGDLTAKQIQILEREIAYVCYTRYHTLMTVGIYARNDTTPHEQAVREQVYAVIAAHPEVIQAHGFFVDEATHTISVDIIISFDCDNADEVYDAIHAELHRIFEGYAVHIVLDRDYSLT